MNDYLQSSAWELQNKTPEPTPPQLLRAADRPTELDRESLEADRLVNAMTELDGVGRMDPVDALLKELRSLAEANRDNTEIALKRAQGLYHALTGFGRAGEMDRVGGLLEEFRAVAEAHAKNIEIALVRAVGLLSVSEWGPADRNSNCALEAVRVCRPIALERPEEGLPILVISLSRLAKALGMTGSHSEARETLSEMFQQVERLLEVPEIDPALLALALDALIEAVAAGHTARAIEVVTNSSRAGTFEPFIIGSRIFLGEKPRVAQEILEVGKDVAERIHRIEEIREG
jgi:hypothetical protein